MTNSLVLPLLGLSMLATTAMAQTKPVAKQPAPRTVETSSAAARPADAQVSTTAPATPAAPPKEVTASTSSSDEVVNSYAAPGQPVNIGKHRLTLTPYDGPAAHRNTSTKSTTAPPR